VSKSPASKAVVVWCNVFTRWSAGFAHAVSSVINLFTALQASRRGRTPSSPVCWDTDAHGKDQPGKKGLVQQWKGERVERMCKVLCFTLKKSLA